MSGGVFALAAALGLARDALLLIIRHARNLCVHCGHAVGGPCAGTPDAPCRGPCKSKQGHMGAGCCNRHESRAPDGSTRSDADFDHLTRLEMASWIHGRDDTIWQLRSEKRAQADAISSHKANEEQLRRLLVAEREQSAARIADLRRELALVK